MKSLMLVDMDAVARSIRFHSCWRDKSDIPAGADAFAHARRQRRSRSAGKSAAREAGHLDWRLIRRARIGTALRDVMRIVAM
jgi:hypothetical protein